MPSVIDLDATLLKRGQENFWLQADDASAGVGLDGREQIVFAENRRWLGEISFVRMDRAAAARANVIGDQLRGRANILRVPVCNHWTLRYSGDPLAFYGKLGLTAVEVAAGHQLFSDGFGFSDGSGFALPDYADPVTAAAAVAGATSLQLAGFMGTQLAIGAFFSINDFLYRVAANDAGVVTFNPPLREAVGQGVSVAVSQPFVQMRLAAPEGWRVMVESFRRGAPMTIGLTEAFER